MKRYGVLAADPLAWAARPSCPMASAVAMRVGEFARGPAVVRDRVVAAVLPAAFAAESRPGLPLKLISRAHAPGIA